MDPVPKEIWLQIGGYLNFDDFRYFTEFLECTLNDLDYLFLITNRFPLYYRPAIMQYNLENIYKSLIILDTIIKIREDLKNAADLKRIHSNLSWADIEPSPQQGGPIRSNVVNISMENLTNYHYIKFEIYNGLRNSMSTLNWHNIDTSVLYDLYRYLEGECFSKNINMALIYVRDDLEIFIKISKGIPDRKYIEVLNYNSIKILEYILQHKMIEPSEIKVKLLSYKHKYKKPVEELLIKYVHFTNRELLQYVLIYDCPLKMLDKILLDLTKDEFFDEFIIFFDRDLLMNYDIFRKLWDIHKDQLTNEQVEAFYMAAITMIRTTSNLEINSMRFMATVCQHPFIIKKYVEY